MNPIGFTDCQFAAQSPCIAGRNTSARSLAVHVQFVVHDCDRVIYCVQYIKAKNKNSSPTPFHFQMVHTEHTPNYTTSCS